MAELLHSQKLVFLQHLFHASHSNKHCIFFISLNSPRYYCYSYKTKAVRILMVLPEVTPLINYTAETLIQNLVSVKKNMRQKYTICYQRVIRMYFVHFHFVCFLWIPNEHNLVYWIRNGLGTSWITMDQDGVPHRFRNVTSPSWKTVAEPS